MSFARSLSGAAHVRLIGPVLLLLCGLWLTDTLLSEDRTVGWERNTVRNGLHRVHAGKDARVVLLGSSTSADWLPNSYLAKVLGAPKPNDTWRWAKTQGAKPAGTHACGYDDDEIAYKTAVTEALLDDLRDLAEVSYFMLLPDDLLTEGTPAQQAAWEKHRALHTALVDARPWVRLVDLSTGLPGLPGARRREDFKDGTHVSAAGLKAQQALFEARLKALGVAK